MSNLVKICFVILSLIASTASYATDLTEDSVNNFITNIDNAVINLNADKVAQALSDSVIIIMNINMQGQKQVMKPSKQEYIAMLQQGWAMYTNYKYSRSNVKIKIQDNKASVSADVKESMTVQGQNISGESKEEVTIELIDGKPLVTKIIGHTSM